MGRLLSARFGLIAFLLIGLFVALPDEGTAATKRLGGSMGWNLKENVKLRMINPGSGGVIEESTPTLAEARSGSPGAPGDPLPTHTVLGIINPDATDVGDAGSMDVYYDGAPGTFPAHSSYHMTVEFTAPDSTVRGVATLGETRNNPSDPTTLDHQYWESDSLITIPGSPSYLHTLIGETNPDQPGLQFTNLHIQPGSSFSPEFSSFFDVFFEIDLLSPGVIDPNEPIFWLTTDAQVPEPASLLCGSAVLLGLMRRRRV